MAIEFHGTIKCIWALLSISCVCLLSIIAEQHRQENAILYEREAISPG
jgi:hypothetical protein